MKKLLILSILCVMFVSCERTVYVDRIIEKPVPKIIKDLEVPTGSWQYTNKANNNYYFAEIDMPEITKNVYDNALIVTYMEVYNSDNTSSLIPLPSVRHKEALEGGNVVRYTETIDCEYSIGKVTIFVTYSDFKRANPDPGTIHFLIKIML